MLGISEELTVSPQHLSFLPNLTLRFVFGSDGVFTRGTRTSKREIERLSHGLRTGGVNYLVAMDVADDKSVILVERGCAAATDAPPALAGGH
jgi:hypothetical protein